MITFSPETVRERVNAAKGQWPVICKETGLGYSWLSKFAADRIPSPAWKRIQALAEYFQKQEA